jgi:hypothetical protein
MTGVSRHCLAVIVHLSLDFMEDMLSYVADIGKQGQLYNWGLNSGPMP